MLVSVSYSLYMSCGGELPKGKVDFYASFCLKCRWADWTGHSRIYQERKKNHNIEGEMYIYRLFTSAFNTAYIEMLCIYWKHRSKNKTARAPGDASADLTCRVREGKDPEILTTITVPSRWGGWRWIPPCLKKIILLCQREIKAALLIVTRLICCLRVGGITFRAKLDSLNFFAALCLVMKKSIRASAWLGWQWVSSKLSQDGPHSAQMSP